MIIERSKNLFQTQHPLMEGHADKGKPRKSSIVSPRMVKRIKREICRNPLQTSKEIFESVGLPNKSKSTRCHILKSISKCGKPVARPPLKCIHREKRLKWAQNNMKINFENVIFTDECRATWMVRMVGVEAVMMHSYPLLRGYNASKVVVELCSGQA